VGAVRRALLIIACLLALPSTAGAAVDYGPISHQGLKSAGAAPTGLKLTLQIGLVANNSGIASAVKTYSDPTSSSYGKYPSLSTLASKYGAKSSVSNAVQSYFKSEGNSPQLDVTHLRVTVTVSIGKAQGIFGTKWNLYKTGTPNQYLALPVNTPKLPKGLSGNVDTIAGLRANVSHGASKVSSASVVKASPRRDGARVREKEYFGGTPTRTGTVAPNCLDTADPGVLTFGTGLFPNQIQTAYGIAPLHAAGLYGQGSRLAIVGEAPTPVADLNAYRSCFGLPGTALKVHNAGSIQPILESSLDAQTVALVAPQLSNLDLWVQNLDDNADDGDVDGFLEMIAAPIEAAGNGSPLPDVISISYGECEATVQPFTASRTLVERELAAAAALGITVVIASGDSGSSTCSRGVPASQLTSAEKAAQTSWPATSPYVLAVGGTNLTLNADNSIAATGAWNDTQYPAPYTQAAGGGGGLSILNSRPWWQPATSFSMGKRMVPDVAAFADPNPGYPIVCSTSVQSCGAGYRNGQSIAFVGGTSAAAPLVAGMIALWKQQARQAGLPKPGFVAPLLYAMRAKNPQAFVDITQGTNALFGGPCCTSLPGFDLTTGLGSPLANIVNSLLASRG
jgi:kumamolisin